MITLTELPVMKEAQTQTEPMRAALIAPCGMNCRLCMAYNRARNPCPGCRIVDSGKPKTRARCRIKTCEKLVNREYRYCFACNTFPCTRLVNLDQRYKAKYGMSMVENLTQIRATGIRRFIRREQERWACPRCGTLICVHKPRCLSCAYEWR